MSSEAGPEASSQRATTADRTALGLVARIAELEQEVAQERRRCRDEAALRVEITQQAERAQAEAATLLQRLGALTNQAPGQLLDSVGGSLSVDPAAQPVSSDMLRGAYLYFLGREPEGPFDPSNYSSFAHMRREFLRSDELVSLALNQRFGPVAPRWAMLEFCGGRRLWIDLADTGVSHGMLFAEWEPEITAWLRRRVRQGDVFVDAGANLGWFTVLVGSLLKEFGGGGRVIGFEPNPRILPRLQDAISASRLTHIATVLPFAVADHVGTLELHIPRQGRNTGGASIGLPPGIGEYETVAVPVCVLDGLLDVVSRVDFIKLDVEGAERLALCGAWGLLARDHPWIICELNDEALRSVSQCSAMDIVAMLAERGYKAYDPQSEQELDASNLLGRVEQLAYPTLIFGSHERKS